MGVDNDALADLLATTLKDLPKGQFEVMWDSPAVRVLPDLSGEQAADRRRHVDPAERDPRPERACPVSPAVRHRSAGRRSEHAHDRRAVGSDRHRLLVGRGRNPPAEELLEGVHQPAGVPPHRADVGLRRTDRGARLVTPTSATDKLYPYGIPYYINFLDDGATTGGFNGKTIRYQGGTTGTICAGIDAATESEVAELRRRVHEGGQQPAPQAPLGRSPHPLPPAPIVNKPGQDKVGSPIKLYANDDT
jgi:hypothetical protein